MRRLRIHSNGEDVKHYSIKNNLCHRVSDNNPPMPFRVRNDGMGLGSRIHFYRSLMYYQIFCFSHFLVDFYSYSTPIAKRIQSTCHPKLNRYHFPFSNAFLCFISSMFLSFLVFTLSINSFPNLLYYLKPYLYF